jgi:hypothetical protein
MHGRYVYSSLTHFIKSQCYNYSRNLTTLIIRVKRKLVLHTCMRAHLIINWSSYTRSVVTHFLLNCDVMSALLVPRFSKCRGKALLLVVFSVVADSSRVVSTTTENTLLSFGNQDVAQFVGTSATEFANALSANRVGRYEVS